MHRIHLFLALLTIVAGRSFADVRLPAVLGDGMVLQHGMELPFWGWAEPGERVRVKVLGQQHETVADDDGRWRVTLEPLALRTSPTTPDAITITIKGSNRIELKDVLVGEVWVCSGQSNMKWELQATWDADLEMPLADYPLIRLLTIETPGSQEPIETCDAVWESCTPKSVRRFSAVGYYFGQMLHRRTGLPIGLIDNAWGGSSCEAWTPRERLADDPMYAALMDRWRQTEATYDVPAAEAKHREAMTRWRSADKAARAAGKPRPPRPRWENPLTGKHRPGNLFHGRLGPILPFGIRGVIWYQGESNAGRAYQYRELFPLMIRSWRDAWRQGDFPFYWVQLADYRAEQTTPRDSDWAELREAQTLTLDREPNTGQAVIIDLGEAADIHPRHKREVGNRLARLALANDYGIDVASESPRYASHEITGDRVLVTLTGEEKLRKVDSAELLGFTIAGDQGRFVTAEARLVGPHTVEVRSDDVASPVAVRYAWADNPVCNLYTQTGLPVTPFRTDDWPGKTADAR